MMISSDSKLASFMRRANELAQLGLGKTASNPIVGAILIDDNGNVLGEGFHERERSGKHAEIVALDKAGESARGATLIITLEPCNHHGSTPPCSEALIAAGVRSVIYSVTDPNPIAQGGADRLRAAGINVESGLLSEEVTFANRAWLTKIEKNRPYITLKIAATLDGKIAADDGTSKWITNEFSRADVARLRSECNAIVTGTGTIIADNPALTVRGVTRAGFDFQPTRVILGKREIPSDAKVLDQSAPTIEIKSDNLDELIKLAVARSWNRVLVEAGPRLTSAFLKAELFDELFVYQAPTILGGKNDFSAELGITTLSQRLDLELLSTEILGDQGKNLRIHLTAVSR